MLKHPPGTRSQLSANNYSSLALSLRFLAYARELLNPHFTSFLPHPRYRTNFLSCTVRNPSLSLSDGKGGINREKVKLMTRQDCEISFLMNGERTNRKCINCSVEG
ncbi:hypothetical protein TNIN_122341 [Trichonephila inaurata madagascariensis]|uniref:Uncharacterized protein n=1 Tax=Trichonephila inaurata madagascariensis TaxID=2747483 RepID=A0A8X6XI91_9ARAC|nr:hypothetical protein TNIN_122341 [Trichonephila inaurata madagascariensis]